MCRWRPLHWASTMSPVPESRWLSRQEPPTEDLPDVHQTNRVLDKRANPGVQLHPSMTGQTKAPQWRPWIARVRSPYASYHDQAQGNGKKTTRQMLVHET